MWYPCTYPPDFAAFETQGLITRAASSATWFNRVYPQQSPFPLKDATNEDDEEDGEDGQLVPVVHGFLPLSAPPPLDYNNGCPSLSMGIQRSTSSCGFYPGNSSFLPINGIQQNSKLDAEHPLEKSDKDLAFQSSELQVQAIPDGKTKGVTGSLEAPEALEAPKKMKDYSDSSLTPDSTLPPVIRRRNRNRRKKLATSLVEATPGTASWEQEGNKVTPRMRSQSISDDQWAQVMASQAAPFTSAHTHHTHTPGDMTGFATTRRGFNNSSGRCGGNLGRGMVSSASVCDLNALSQQQQHPHFNNSGVNSANSFQQLNLMNYGGGMMWPPCELCQGAPMYPGHHGGGNMKRTASNLSMNVSSMSSDLTGYPWAPHVHHHMPVYPGYFPGYHPHMVPMSMQGSSVGLNMSIPDSMHTFGKVPSSPAPSLRSSSHRSNKSSKSRSFSTADLGRRTRSRNKRRSDSEESQSSSGSENDEEDDGGKPGSYPRGNLPWQCEHCTFINSASARSCGMCSKSMGGTNGGEKSRWSRRGSEKRRSERRRDRRTDHEDDVQDISDFDNDGGVVKSNLSFNIKDSRKDSRSKITSSSKNSSKNKKKSRRRSSSASPSGSGSGHEDEDIQRVEKHMRDMRISSRSRAGDYDGVPRDRDRNRDKDRNRDRSARKKEGRNRFKSRGHHTQERSRTPARQTPQRSSPVERSPSPSPEQNTHPKEKSGSESSKQEEQNSENPADSGEDQTMVDKVPSENTVRQDEPLVLHSSTRKSQVSLRPESPEPNVEDASPVHEEEPKDEDDGEEEEEEEEEIQIRVEETFDVPQYIKRMSESPKPLSKSPSPSKGDENSLANTLDEIETMGTNEVADFEISAPFDEIPAIVDPRQQIINDTPVMAYIPQPSPEPAAYKAFVQEPEMKNDLSPVEVGDRDFWLEIAHDRPSSPLSDAMNDKREEHHSESSEKEEESVPQEQSCEPRYEPIEDTGYMQREQPIEVPAPWNNDVEANEGADDATLMIDYTEETPKEEMVGEIIEPREVARSNSSGSSAGRGSGRHERQCTPLSFSSSDAQFYSPPDSPDLSLSDKLTDQGIICKMDLEDEVFLGGSMPSTGTTDGYERFEFEDTADLAGNTDLSNGVKFQGRDEEKQEFPIYAKISKLKKEAERKARCVVEDSGDASEKYMTVEEIIIKRKQETMRKQGLEIVQTLREAEELGYNAEEVSIALTLCGDKPPLQWLQDNWRHMVDTVLTLATNYGHERQSSDIGSITATEARSCLRLHRGNIWAAVTESVDQRQKEINEINSRGNFKHEDIIRTLEQYDGNPDLAFRDLNRKKLTAETQKKSRQPVAELSPQEDSALDKNSLTSQEDLIQEILDLSRGEDDYDYLDVTYVGLSDSSDEYLYASGGPQERGQENIIDVSSGSRAWPNLEVSREEPKRVSAPQEAYDDEPAVEDLVASPDHHTTYDYLTALDDTTDADEDEAKHSEVPPEEEEEEEEEEHNEDEEVTASDSDEAAAELKQLGADSPGGAGDDDFKRGRHELQLVRKEGISEESNITYESGMTTTTSESVTKSTEDEIQAAPARARPGTGPVTVQKATAIVGKAIAKAMAREHDVRSSSRLSETPEPPSLDTTEESIEPPSATPEPSEDEDITTHVTSSVTVSESEDDEHLRTLDTIPEEEEISERTESGRTRSRTSFKNLVLPFDPNNVVQLQPIPHLVRDVPVPRGWTKPSTEATTTPSEATVNRSKDTGVKDKTETQSARPEEKDYVNEPMQRYVNVDPTANDKAGSSEAMPQDYESISEVQRELDDSKARNSEMTNTITTLVSSSPPKTTVRGEKSTVDVDADSKRAHLGAGKRQRGRNKSGWDEATTTSDISDGTYAKTMTNSRSAAAYSTVTATSTESVPASKSSKSESSGSSTDTQTTASFVERQVESAKEDDKTEEVIEEVSQTPAEVEKATKSETNDKPESTQVKESAADKEGTNTWVKTKGKWKKATTEPKKKGKTATSTTKDQNTTSNSKRTQDDKEISDNRNTMNTAQEKATPTTTATPVVASTSTTVSKNTVTHNVTATDQNSPTSTTANTSNRMGVKSSSRKVASLIKKRSTSLDSSEESGEDFNDQAQPETTRMSPAAQEVPELLVQVPEILGKEPPKEPEDHDTRRQYEQLKFDRTVRRLLAEGHTGSYEKAELATHLMSLDFEETVSITAAEECSSIYTALQFLQQECELCAEKYPMGKMVSMLHCIHRCCHDCAKTYFTFQIKTKNIREVRCPFCNEPDLDASEEIATEYFNNLDILLKNILDPGTHELFQRKLRDWTLMKDPNFRWCNKCSSGFIANPLARKLYCPDCRDVTCAQCRLPWESAHDGISCEEFTAWKADNNVEVSEATVSKHLAECGITCPNCKFTYSLAKGGCMHFTCTQCKFEFCSGCGQPFMQGARCPVGPYCERLGLHAHHPRNCLFYLRDKEPYQLQKLLKDAGIEFDIDSKEEKTICQVQEQKELPEGLIDDICGRVVPKGYAGLCRLHYTEYLVEKINGSRLDPVSIFDEADLRVCLRRNGKTVPVRRWESEKGYRDKLIKLIKEQLPLQ